MEAKEKEILNELISGTKCQFVIPVFQRNYDWRTKDCERLFNDIVDLARDVNNLDRKHFIGAFVCKFNKFIDMSFNQYILIDGQQRLTSITLILKALYDYLGSFGEKYEELRSEINETYLINKFAKDSNLKLKLKPNKVDNDNYIKLMNGENPDIESTIGRNYSLFKENIKKMDISIESFYNALQRLEGVVVFLGDEDNPQVIFESLNSTGLELTDLDLIRNYLLMNCHSDVQDKLYMNYWVKIEQILGNNFLQFIRDYLSLKNGIVTPQSKNQIYFSFQKFYKKENYDKEEFLKDLLNLAGIYKKLTDVNPLDSDLSKALNDYIELDIKTTYPFVFGLLIDNFQTKKISDIEMVEILRLLEAYLIRRNVCNLAGGGLSQVMASLYNELKKKYSDKFYNDPSNKIAMALAGINTKAYFPKDEEFTREFKSRDMFHNRNINYILEKIETSVQGKEKLIDPSNLTIEHVMPQVLSKDWIIYLNMDNLKEQHEQFVHTIGNLTLTSYNSEMSNKLYSEKKSHVEFSRLYLNQYFKNVNCWNISEIEKRAEFLSKIAINLWPYPMITKIDDISKESHFLLDEDNYEYTGTTPAGIQINDDNIIAYTWSDLYVESLKYLYNKNKELFIKIFTRENYVGSEKPLISKNITDLRNSCEFIDEYYVEVNNNTERKIQILRAIFKDFNYDQVDVILYIK